MHVTESYSFLLRLIHNAPAEIDRDWLHARYLGLGEVTDAEFSELRVRTMPSVETGMKAFDRIEIALNSVLALKCARSEYQRSPHVAVRFEPLPKDTILRGNFGVEGWIISYIVRRSEIAEAEPDFATLDRVHDEFDAIVEKWALETGRHSQPAPRTRSRVR